MLELHSDVHKTRRSLGISFSQLQRQLQCTLSEGPCQVAPVKGACDKFAEPGISVCAVAVGQRFQVWPVVLEIFNRIGTHSGPDF